MTCHVSDCIQNFDKGFTVGAESKHIDASANVNEQVLVNVNVGAHCDEGVGVKQDQSAEEMTDAHSVGISEGQGNAENNLNSVMNHTLEAYTKISAEGVSGI